METRISGLLRDIDRYRDEQDADLMISCHDIEILIASLTPTSSLGEEDKGLVRSAILVRRYDLKRGRGSGGAEELEVIENWLLKEMPDGTSPDYPYQYLVSDEDLKRDKS